MDSKTYEVKFESHDAMTSDLATLHVKYQAIGEKTAVVNLTSDQLNRLCSMGDGANDDVEEWAVISK